MRSLLEDPATWFLIWGILIILAIIIYWAITQVINAAFWTIIVLGIIVVLWGIIGLFINRRGKKKKKTTMISESNGNNASNGNRSPSYSSSYSNDDMI